MQIHSAQGLTVELFLDRVDRVMHRLQRDLECCDRALVDCCGVTVAQSYALLALWELGQATMNEFAAEMRLHGTTMTRMVDALIEKGLVERRADPEDRRIVARGVERCRAGDGGSIAGGQAAAPVGRACWLAARRARDAHRGPGAHGRSAGETQLGMLRLIQGGNGSLFLRIYLYYTSSAYYTVLMASTGRAAWARSKTNLRR